MRSSFPWITSMAAGIFLLVMAEVLALAGENEKFSGSAGAQQSDHVRMIEENAARQGFDILCVRGQVVIWNADGTIPLDRECEVSKD
jgi:1-aminocyclopropane-1-carboxylate deaminase/D-cysteine desulfhydrase-like pyridoxal-dependent ACC family enzyme